MDAVIDPRKEPDDKSEKCGNSLANFLAKSPHDINDKGSDETTYNHLPKRCNKNNNQGKSNKNPQTLIGITRSPLSSSVCHNHPLQELSSKNSTNCSENAFRSRFSGKSTDWTLRTANMYGFPANFSRILRPGRRARAINDVVSSSRTARIGSSVKCFQNTFGEMNPILVAFLVDFIEPLNFINAV